MQSIPNPAATGGSNGDEIRTRLVGYRGRQKWAEKNYFLLCEESHGNSKGRVSGLAGIRSGIEILLGVARMSWDVDRNSAKKGAGEHRA